MECVECSKKFQGREAKFCSRKCKNKSGNIAYKSYLALQRCGSLRKIKRLKMYRRGCEKCGYSKNNAALEFHHFNPETKSFQLDLRSLSNRKWLAITEEAKKCILLCSCAMQNCTILSV
jgi:hypothetical protein